MNMRIFLKSFLYFFILLGTFNLQAQTPLTEAVDFEVTDLEGNNIHLFELLDEGNYVFIDFYFTTCVPCQDAVPKISEAFEYFGCGEHDVFFMAMDYGNTDAQCIEFDEEFNVAYPSVSGVEGGGTAVCDAYQIPLYPSIVLIAPDRSIVEQNIWPIPSAEVVISTLESYGITENNCSLDADFIAYNNDICENEYMLFQDRSLGDISSWEWTFEGGIPPTSNEQNPMILFTNPGDFDVSLTIYNEDEESSITMEEIARVHHCTGTSNAIMESIHLSPNPSNGSIHITFPNPGVYTLYVYDISGAMVYETIIAEGDQNIDLQHLKPGIYLTKVENENDKHQETIIIQ